LEVLNILVVIIKNMKKFNAPIKQLTHLDLDNVKAFGSAKLQAWFQGLIDRDCQINTRNEPESDDEE
jgi:hypothetical protein